MIINVINQTKEYQRDSSFQEHELTNKKNFGTSYVKFCVCNMVARKMWYKIKHGLTLRAEHGPGGVPKHTAESGVWI